MSECLIYIFLHFTFLKRNKFEIRVFSYHSGSNFPLLCRCFSHGMLQLRWRCRGGDEGDIARYFLIGFGGEKGEFILCLFLLCYVTCNS